MDGSGETATTIAELAGRIAGGGKQVAGATQAEVLWQLAQAPAAPPGVTSQRPADSPRRR